MNDLWIVNIDDINKGTGQAIRMKHLIINLSKYYNISLITSTNCTDDSILKNVKKYYYCKNIRIYSENIKNPKSIIYLVNLFRCINRIIKDDIPIYTDSHHIAFLIKTFGRKNPVITECHGSNAEELVAKKIIYRGSIFYKILSRIEKIDWKIADGIVSNDDQTKKYLVKNGLNPDKIFVSYNGVDLSIFQPDNKTDIRKELGLKKKFIMIYIGSFRSWHGVDTLLTVIDKLHKKNNDIVLLLIGDGPERKRVEELSKELGIEKNTIFIDYVNHNEIPKYIAAADICPYFPPEPSKKFTRSFSGTPIKFFEYLAMGKPIITTNQPEFKFITENNCGILINNTIDNFEKNIEHLIENKKLRKQLGENGKKFIKNERTWDKITNNIANTINSFSSH